MSITFGRMASTNPPTLDELVPSLMALCQQWQTQPTPDISNALFDLCGAVMLAHCLDYATVTGDWTALGEAVEVGRD